MNAAFMDAVIFYGGMSGPTTYTNAICVFEHSPSECADLHQAVTRGDGGRDACSQGQLGAGGIVIATHLPCLQVHVQPLLWAGAPALILTNSVFLSPPLCLLPPAFL